MKNTLNDLNNHLFEQLERLNSDDLQGDKLTAEISRAKAMAVIATQIVNGAKTKVDAYRLTSKGEIPTLKLIGD